jgi:DNA-binding GntR family transcriptional regulator
VREIVGGQDYGIHETTADEHLDILAALARFDAESAAEAMKKQEYKIAYIDKNMNTMD